MYLRAYMLFCAIFFFKQKTAYEMRISDWSSDVCSSDLWDRNEGPISTDFSKGRENQETLCLIGGAEGDRTPDLCNAIAALSQLSYGPICPGRSVAFSQAPRSEEHTSELQSLMRISYAVFCLKKKTTIKIKSEKQICDQSTLHAAETNK